MSVPEWLPNWRKEEEYPDPEIAGPHDWAWEFLRRNELYQADCEKVRKVLAEQGFLNIDGNSIFATELFFYALNHKWHRRLPCREVLEKMLVNAEGSRKNEIEKMLATGVVTRRDYGEFETFAKSLLPSVSLLRKKYAFYEYFDDPNFILLPENLLNMPVDSVVQSRALLENGFCNLDGESTSFFTVKSIMDGLTKPLDNLHLGSKYELKEFPVKNSEIAFTIDVKGNVNSQVECIRKFASNIQNEYFRKIKQKKSRNATDWALCLRVYDARLAEKATSVTIGRVLYPNLSDDTRRDNVDNHLVRAKRLINGDYIKIFQF